MEIIIVREKTISEYLNKKSLLRLYLEKNGMKRLYKIKSLRSFNSLYSIPTKGYRLLIQFC